VLPPWARERTVEIARRLGDSPVDAGVTGMELRLEFGSERMHVTVAARRGSTGSLAAWCDALLGEVPGVLGVAVPSQQLERGESELRHRILSHTLLAHHLAFFQTNLHLTPPLAAAAGDAVSDPARLVDLYCGVGLHSVLAANAGSSVTGVDTNRWAIESACRNAALHGLAGARFERIPAERLAGRPEVHQPNTIFVNPSRYGCAPGLPARIARWRPGSISLVSCSIESHARDLAAFAAAGYQAQPVESFDMFPFSPFVESVTTLLPG
jgi:hypothetical protein